MSELRKATKDVLIYTLVNIIPIFLGFISIPIYTRIFDPAEYGQLSIVQMTANYTVIFMLTWISSSFLRFYEAYKKQEREQEFVNTYLILLLLIVPGSMVLYSIFLLFAWSFHWFDPILFKLFIVGAFLLFFNGFINFTQTFYRTKRKSISFAVVAVSNSLFTLLAGLLFVLAFKFRVNGILIGSTVVSAIIAVVVMGLLIREYGLSLKKFNREMVTEAFLYGVPVIFSGFSNWILRFSDRYVIQATRNSSEVGLYSVSYNISEKTIMLIITAISLAVTPILISTWEHKGKKETEKVLSHFSRYQYLLLLPATVGLIVLAPGFMRIFVGKEFLGGIQAAQVVTAGIFFLGLYNLTNTGLYIAKKTRIIARNVFVVGLFNVGMNVILVPRFGYIVAAYTTMTSYLLLWVISYFQTKEIIKWSIEKSSFLKTTFAAVVMAFVLIFWDKFVKETPLMTLLSVAVGAVAYFAVLLATGEITKELTFAKKYLMRKLKHV